jgi:UDP-N-acetylglucosamine 2-epimerase
MKIATIVGTRPQYIKLDPTLPNQVIINTGQHYDELMKDVFVKEFGIEKFDYECNATDLIEMTQKVREALKKEEPTCVVVYGDCRSTLAGALAASDLNIPIVHVEAGMRAYRHDMPEERIRVIVDHMSHILLVPDLEAGENLERSGS